MNGWSDANGRIGANDGSDESDVTFETLCVGSKVPAEAVDQKPLLAGED